MLVDRIPLYWLAPTLFVVAIVGFVLLMARHLRVFAVARPAPAGNQAGWFASMFKYSVIQVRMFRDLDAGLLHAAIFWGFVTLTVGTADRVTFGLIEHLVRPLLDGWLWRLLVLGQNAFVITVLGAVAYALFRRLVWRYPRRTTLSRDGVLILLLIGAVVLSEWFAEAFRLARYGDPDQGWAVAALPLSFVLKAVFSTDVLGAGYSILFWANVAVVSFFLVYLPRSKHLHIVTAFFNAALRKMKPRGELPPMDLEAADARFGIKTVADLSWKDLLDGFTCTECGRCQEACPAWATGKPLNPKTLIMGIREQAVEAEKGVPLIPWIKGASLATGVDRPIVDTAIPYDAVWDCVTCGACVEACPVMIEHVDKIVGLRRNLVLEESRFPEELAVSFNNLERYSNIWGQPQTTRLDWA
ncbi:MAG: (Fe-S)-binding protein, partial [Chloroflexota bacterium]